MNLIKGVGHETSGPAAPLSITGLESKLGSVETKVLAELLRKPVDSVAEDATLRADLFLEGVEAPVVALDLVLEKSEPLFQ